MESFCLFFVEFLEIKNAGLEFSEIHEVIRGQDFTLEDGKINLDLSEPTGMDGGMNQDRVRIPPGDSIFRRLAPMRRAVVGDHKVTFSQRFSPPPATVKIENRSGLLFECRIPRKESTPVRPGTKGIMAEPAPNRRAAYGGDDASLHGLLRNFLRRKGRQRKPRSRGSWQARALISITTSGGKNAGPAAS